MTNQLLTADTTVATAPIWAVSTSDYITVNTILIVKYFGISTLLVHFLLIYTMKTQLHHLVQVPKKTGYYYLRVKLSDELASFYDCKQIKESLRTKNKKLAMQLRDDKLERILNKVYFTAVREVELLSDCINEYLNDKEGVRYETIYAYRIVFKQFLKVVGNKRVNELCVNDLRKYKAGHKESKLHPNTVKRHFSAIKCFLRWLGDNEYLEIKYSGIFRSMRQCEYISGKQSFSDSDVNLILEYCKRFKDHKKYAWRYWMPLLYFFSGCRRREISQLTTKDVVLHENRYCIDINDDKVVFDNTHYQKTVKNNNSKRLIPLHPKLLDLQFIEWVESKRDGFLFNDLTGRNITNFFSGMYKGVNGGLVVYLKIQAPPPVEPEFKHRVKSKSLHSARHTFIDKLKQAYAPYDVLEELTGHASPYVMINNYASKHSIKTKYEVIGRVGYEFIV